MGSEPVRLGHILRTYLHHLLEQRLMQLMTEEVRRALLPLCTQDGKSDGGIASVNWFTLGSSESCRQGRIMMPDNHKPIDLPIDERELATILAALRFHQDENLQGTGDIPDQAVRDIATDAGRLEPLDYDEVGPLCERINTAAAKPSPGEAVQRIHDLLYLDIEDGREFYNADKSWDADILDAIAEVVSEHIPRPEAAQPQPPPGKEHKLWMTPPPHPNRPEPGRGSF